jgi:hypothetical protein
MPALASHELGALGQLECRRAGCGKNAATSGSGFQLPFCPDDLQRLTRKTFDAIVGVSGASIFDLDATLLAGAVVANARLELRQKAASK